MRVANNSLTVSTIVDRYVAHYNTKLTKKQVKQVIYLFNKLLSHWIINKGYVYKLPHRLGKLSVAKRKMQYTKLHFDYGEWNKTGRKTYHINEHSDGWYASCHWEKKNCRVPNKRWYSFSLTRGNQRAISSNMKQEGGHQIYKEWN